MIASPNTTSANPVRTITVTIKRQNGPSEQPRWESFQVQTQDTANLISVLQSIAARPVTTEGSATTPVVYDSGCLEEVCGSCAMVINGRVRPACSALVGQIVGEDNTITIEPMGKFPVVRDLSVDRERMFAALRRVKAWVPIDGTYDLGAGPQETPDRQETRYVMSTCMSCGCCLEACPQYQQEADPKAWDTSFVGAAAINQARLFNMHATGATEKEARLEVLTGEGGVNDCGNAQNCVKVCPKEIPLTESIAAIGRDVTVHAVKKFFTGR
jgi:succinate dehydrogenase / fumarate reductase iron-sulfur subunit